MLPSACLVLVCLVLAVPSVRHPEATTAITGYLVALTAITVALVTGWRLLPRSDRAAWRWIVAGTLSGVAGSTLWTMPASAVLPTFHGVGLQDLLWLCVYPLTIRGVVLLIRDQRLDGVTRRAVVLDTVVVTSAATVIAWHLLISPSFADPAAAQSLATVVAMAYPLGDVAMFALAAALLITPARRGLPEALLVAALATELPLDLVNAFIVAHDPGAAAGWYRAGYLAINATIAAAVLYPRAPSLRASTTAQGSTLHGWRILLLGAGLSGVALSTLFLPESGLRRIPVALAVVAALSSILVRFHRAVRALETAERALHHQVTHDQLTGAASRTLLMNELSAAVRHSMPVLIFVDLDGFKLVNDSLGHRAGDHVLLAVAERLASVVRQGDLVARIGGDEFVVVCHGVDEREAEALGRRLGDAVRRPLTIDGQSVSVGASVGVLVPEAHPGELDEDRVDALVTELLAAADSAMYDAKHSGGGLRLARHVLTG